MELNIESKIEKGKLFDEYICTIYGDLLSVPERPYTNDVKYKDLMVYEYEETCDIPEEYPVYATGKTF